MRAVVPADHYQGYQDLLRAVREGEDFRVLVEARRAARTAVIAPHGGRIEGGTSEIARLLAGDEHHLYLFEGLRTTGDNFHHLHLTSSRFDEPRCLELIAGCATVIAVHGYATDGPDVLLGGRDEDLKSRLAAALGLAGLSCQADGHRFPGLDPNNVCNRGALGRGVQLEFSAAFRRRRDWQAMVGAVRAVLAGLAVEPAGHPPCMVRA
jgi:phage replication-related protein YjqB (UPF0714/DUF867 family)